MKEEGKREKNWKHLYIRSTKLARAKQLGIEYPRISETQIMTQPDVASGDKMNVLFVCSKNQWRSPTAEAVWRRHPKLNVRSAGTSPNARHHVSEEDIRWADVILVMEEKHKSRLRAEYTRVLEFKQMHVLDIPDEYKYMDAELVEQLTHAVRSILDIE
ncbi:low molecular weight protein tyrosine phosphatase family protein [Undibacterium sp.]|uniref:low molecular weight protein tyrosine phosphatase family protein n=1 Tax=Undibacterium sp. TaxID=1914977 RepID=UPI00374D27E4